MNETIDVHPALYAVSMGLVVFSLILSWGLGIALGGFKIGSLERLISMDMDSGQLPGFLSTFQQRTADLGFQATGVIGEYVQGGSNTPLSSFTHARTKKKLTMLVHEPVRESVKVELKLAFLDAIVGDTGESAYRDAVLDYVSGKAEAMKVVPNRSFNAFSCFVGGMCAWSALILLRANHFAPLWVPIVILGAADICGGLLAIVNIARKPSELTGMGLAIGGIALNATAIAAAFVWKAG